MDANETPEPAELFQGKRIAFAGKLGGLTKREAQQLVRQHGGVAADRPHAEVDIVVVGADELPLNDRDELLDDQIRQAAAEGKLEILSETQLWQRLGLVESEQNIRRLYTPAMLADLLGVPVVTIRRWRRRGLIVPVREVHRLPYFDFQEVSTARRLAQLLAAGVSPQAIEKKLAEFARYLPHVERPLAQLSVIVEGRQILLRRGEGLIEPDGQLRIDFEALEDAAAIAEDSTFPLAEYAEDNDAAPPDSAEELLALAARYEEEGHLQEAIDLHRAALAAVGPQAEICFQLAELLYRQGDASAACERYYMAVELDEDYVEARANLGCVLAEQGRLDLAAAAFQGALEHHNDYPDAHYHLAHTLEALGRPEDAEPHWRRFLELSPDSPWADAAWERL